eukprot:2817102-Pyramimonas_sp.AAC.1
MGPHEHHIWRVNDSRLYNDMGEVQVHELVMRVLELLVACHGVNITTLAWAEVLIPTAQMIEYWCSEAGPAGLGVTDNSEG